MSNSVAITSTKFCLLPLHVYKYEKEKRKKGEKTLLYCMYTSCFYIENVFCLTQFSVTCTEGGVYCLFLDKG